MREPERMWESKVSLLVFVGLALSGFVGSALTVGPTEPYFKIALFLMLGAGTTGVFYGLNALHRRRVQETGDPRATLYSALAIWSSLAFTVLCACVVFVIFGRYFGAITEDAANRVSYYFITVLTLVEFFFGVVCVWDTRNRGLLAKKVYLWPWSSRWARRARQDREGS